MYISMVSFTVSTAAKIEFELNKQIYIIRKLSFVCFIAGTDLGLLARQSPLRTQITYNLITPKGHTVPECKTIQEYFSMRDLVDIFGK